MVEAPPALLELLGVRWLLDAPDPLRATDWLLVRGLDEGVELVLLDVAGIVSLLLPVMAILLPPLPVLARTTAVLVVVLLLLLPFCLLFGVVVAAVPLPLSLL